MCWPQVTPLLGQCPWLDTVSPFVQTAYSIEVIRFDDGRQYSLMKQDCHNNATVTVDAHNADVQVNR